jgi:hypothetical protein
MKFQTTHKAEKFVLMSVSSMLFWQIGKSINLSKPWGFDCGRAKYDAY